MKNYIGIAYRNNMFPSLCIVLYNRMWTVYIKANGWPIIRYYNSIEFNYCIKHDVIIFKYFIGITIKD